MMSRMKGMTTVPLSRVPAQRPRSGREDAAMQQKDEKTLAALPPCSTGADRRPERSKQPGGDASADP